jgi:ferric-dicitrate binding protein FerR (iron transport regulator)
MKSFNHIEDIVIDPTFRAWILNDDEHAKQRWLAYLNKYPEKKEMVDAARQILTEMVDLKYKMSDQTLEQSWETIASNLDTYTDNDNQQGEESRRYSIPNYWYAIAATFVGILVVTSLWLFLDQAPLQTYQTAYGETKEILLPDSSIVVLNANSTLQFDKHSFLQQRDVQIDGEAYFDIKKLRDKTANVEFEVFTGNVAVVVLGTKFNVNTRRQNTSVVLEEGKVKLEMPGLNEHELYMEPGQMVTYEHNEMKLKKSIVKPEIHLAWKENKLIFEDTPVQEIIQQLEDNYGINIELQNDQVAKKRYTGTFHDPDPKIILLSLKALFNLKEETKHDQIILK